MLNNTCSQLDMAIVLTGTITPNTKYVAYLDAERRELEYLSMIHYYQNIAPVFFLENSSFEFNERFEVPNSVFLRKIPKSSFIDKGKGFQEFEMLDSWLGTERKPPQRFIKVTGRYRVNNIERIFRECLRKEKDILIVDSYLKTKLSVTTLFYCGVDYYLLKLKGIYREADDSSGNWIEKVLYRYIKAQHINRRLFITEPDISGISGTSGNKISTKKTILILKILRRRLNRAISREEIVL
jgi:hypothetical protein